MIIFEAHYPVPAYAGGYCAVVRDGHPIGYCWENADGTFTAQYRSAYSQSMRTKRFLSQHGAGRWLSARHPRRKTQ